MFIQSLSLFHCSPSFQYVAVVFFHGTSDHSERLFIEPFIFLSVRACMSACVCVSVLCRGIGINFFDCFAFLFLGRLLLQLKRILGGLGGGAGLFHALITDTFHCFPACQKVSH